MRPRGAADDEDDESKMAVAVFDSTAEMYRRLQLRELPDTRPELAGRSVMLVAMHYGCCRKPAALEPGMVLMSVGVWRTPIVARICVTASLSESVTQWHQEALSESRIFA